MIGAGCVGSVYKAFHRDLRIPVAVKVLHEDFQNDIEFCRRFHAEALAASRLDHPNLMRVFDFGQEPDGLLYLAMEHLAGRTLAHEVGSPLPLERILTVMVQVAAGLAHAHARGIVHRDIKPDNIVLVPSRDDDDKPIDLAKVCDFGIAVLEKDGASGTVVGTPAYMSPEQCAGMSELDGRSDVYACGVVLFELATGQLPFTADTPVKLLNRHMNMPPPSPRSIVSSLPASLEDLILKALAKEPDERQASMRDLRNELRAVSRELETNTKPRISVAPKPVAPQTNAPDWLERGAQTTATAFATSAVAVSAEVSPAASSPGQALASELAQRPAQWLARFAAETRRDVFEGLSAQLGWALPLLAAERHLRGLFAVRSTLDAIDVSEPWRAHAIRGLQRILEEPSLLATFAETVLTEDAPAREPKELLLRAGVAGSYALYSARLKLAAQPGVRGRFVALVRLFGANAIPMLRAGLAKLEGNRAHAIAEDLARDLLEGAPQLRDEPAGEILARYLAGGSSPELTAACLVGLVRFWGERARPFVVAAVDAREEPVRLAALRGLKELGTLDDTTTAKVRSAMKRTASIEMKAVAATLLGSD